MPPFTRSTSAAWSGIFGPDPSSPSGSHRMASEQNSIPQSVSEPNKENPTNESNKTPNPTSDKATKLKLLTAEKERVEAELANLEKIASVIASRRPKVHSSLASSESPLRARDIEAELNASPENKSDHLSKPKDDAKGLGDALTTLFKPALERTGSFLTGAAADTIKKNYGDLSKPNRVPFTHAVTTHAKRSDDRVDALDNLKWKTAKDLKEQLEVLNLGGANKRLASTVYECMDADAEFPTFIQQASLRDPELAVNGLYLLHYINHGAGTKGDYDDDKAEKADFDEKPFLVAGVSKMAGLNHGTKLLNEIEHLPIQYITHCHAKHSLVLEKIPPHLKGEHWVKTLKSEFLRATRNGKGTPPWTLEELVDEIATFLSKEEPVIPATTMAASRDGGASRKGNKDGGAHVSENDDGGARARKYAASKCDGVVNWYDKDKKFGFAKAAEGKDIFIHASDLPEGQYPKTGDKISFNVKYDSKKKRDNATNIEIGDSATANVAEAETQTLQPVTASAQIAAPVRQTTQSRVTFINPFG